MSPEIALARILVILHPSTSPINVGRPSCRKLILAQAFAEAQNIIEEEGIAHDRDTA